MVNDLLKVAPNFKFFFDQTFPIQTQAKIANESFSKEQHIWKSNLLPLEQGLPLNENDMAGPSDRLKKPSKKYFETNRKFFHLVPLLYKRTTAPRLSTLGSTFLGMKKVLLIAILKKLSCISDVTFIDVDMSAAHTRIAKFLLSKPESNLSLSLSEANFWTNQINLVMPCFDPSLQLDHKTVKKILKVALYTSMNGGNPFGKERLLYNLIENATDVIRRLNLNTPHKLIDSLLWTNTITALQNFQMIDEVRKINLQCAKKEDGFFSVYTIDKTDPYIVNSQHLGISRVLQSFEVVLLAVLVFSATVKRYLCISLEHDGVLIMVKNTTVDPYTVCNHIFEGPFKEWSTYLLEDPVPLEPKRMIRKGELTEF